MKSRTIKLTASVAVLVVLCGAYVGVKSYVATQEEQESQEEDTSVSVVSVDSDDVASVAFNTSEGKEITLEKNDDSWTVKGEEDFPLSQTTVDSAVGSIAALDADQEISDVEDFSQYDLDEPQKEITLETSEGDKTVLQVGMENTSSSQYYLKTDGDDDKVYLVASSALEAFMGTEYDFAEAESFPTVTSAAITDVKVDKENGYEISQNADTLDWNVSDGKTSEQADTTKTGEITSAIGSLTYGDFVDYNCTDDAKYGFDDPYAVITADYTEEETVEDEDESSGDSSDEDVADEDASGDADTDEETDSTADTDTADENSSDESSDTEETVTVNKQIVIYVGDETDSGRYVKVNDSKQVYTIADDSLSTILDSTISDFYSLTVNYLTVDNLDSLKIQDADGSHTIQVTRTTEEAEDTEDSDDAADSSDSETDSSTNEDTEDSSETEDTADTADDGDTEDSSDESSDDEDTVTVTYTLDGEELDESAFTTFYNKLINMSAQERLTETYEPEEDAAYTFTFKDIDGKETTVAYYEYDSSFYAAVTGDKVYLINKMNVRDLAEAYEEMLNPGSETEE